MTKSVIIINVFILLTINLLLCRGQESGFPGSPTGRYIPTGPHPLLLSPMPVTESPYGIAERRLIDMSAAMAANGYLPYGPGIVESDYGTAPSPLGSVIQSPILAAIANAARHYMGSPSPYHHSPIGEYGSISSADVPYYTSMSPNPTGSIQPSYPFMYGAPVHEYASYPINYSSNNGYWPMASQSSISPYFSNRGYHGYSPKIEIGQKLSNSIYANSDNLRYDLSSLKEQYQSPSNLLSSSPASSTSARGFGSYQSAPISSSSYMNQQQHHHHQYSPSSSSMGEYALASNNYRQYLQNGQVQQQQQQAQSINLSPLQSSPSSTSNSLYNRITQYMNYLSPPSHVHDLTSVGMGTSRSLGLNHLSSLMSSANEHSTSSLSSNNGNQMQNIGKSVAASSLPTSSSSSSSSSSPISQGSSSPSNTKEEIGFFKRSDYHLIN